MSVTLGASASSLGEQILAFCILSGMETYQMVEKKGLECFSSFSAQVTCIFYDGYCSAVYPALEI